MSLLPATPGFAANAQILKARMSEERASLPCPEPWWGALVFSLTGTQAILQSRECFSPRGSISLGAHCWKVPAQGHSQWTQLRGGGAGFLEMGAKLQASWFTRKSK